MVDQITNGIDATTGHIVSTGEIKANIDKHGWQARYDPQQAIDMLGYLSSKVDTANTDIQKLIPELGGAVTADAATAVRDLSYIVIYGLYALTSLGQDPRTYLSQAAVAERLGTSFDYTNPTDTALQNVLGPNYTQYVGKPIPTVTEQQQANGAAGNNKDPMHVIVDNLK